MDDRTARFMSKVDTCGPVPARCPNLGPCWLWKPLGSVHGYGQFTYHGATRLAHRVSHELFKGPIPSGLTIDHLCMVRPCVNPEHLEAVTRAENLRRARSWENGAAFQRSKTHCSMGHPYSGDNLRICKSGKRACRTCDRRYAIAFNARYRATNPIQPRRRQTHCRRGGHEFAVDGYIGHGGKQYCRPCGRERVRKSRARKRAGLREAS